MFIAMHQFEEASTFAGIQQRLCESDHNKDRPSDKDWGENGGWARASSGCSYICHWLRSGGDDQLGSNCNADDKIRNQDHDHTQASAKPYPQEGLEGELAENYGDAPSAYLGDCVIIITMTIMTTQASATQTIPTSSSSTDPELASDITLSSL